MGGIVVDAAGDVVVHADADAYNPLQAISSSQWLLELTNQTYLYPYL